jgi:hypothetical protein
VESVMKRAQYIVTIDFADDDEGAAAEAELLDTVAVLGALFMVRAEAAYGTAASLGVCTPRTQKVTSALIA